MQDPLSYYLDRPVSDLIRVDNTDMSAEESERHIIFGLLAMAIVADSWNGNKKGEFGDYPQRLRQRLPVGIYAGGTYFGHNIASLATDGRGAIIDFDFNHNDLFNSSAEHAEARLVRRIFNLNESYNHWQTVDPKQITPVPYANVLSAVTIYTTLESCAQCSGVMTLGNVKSVVYLQTDPGQYYIGSILYNLSNPYSLSHPHSPPESGPVPKLVQKYGAPEPISADTFQFPHKTALDLAYRAFVDDASTDPDSYYFWRSADGSQVDKSSTITAFLCTDAAHDIFNDAANELATRHVDFPSYQPTESALANAEIHEQAVRYRAFVSTLGRRGTPHK